MPSASTPWPRSSEMEPHHIVQRGPGLRQCEPMPSPEALDRFYTEKYFQTSDIYTATYHEREIAFFNAAARRKLALVASTVQCDVAGFSALEVGVGEGWSLQVLHDHGLTVTGVDYSDAACRQHNPVVADRMRTGKPEAVLDTLIADGSTFDLIWLDNVLEHSPQPGVLLRRLLDLASDDARLIVEVPNDYSKLQLHLLERGSISRPFWEAVPEHLSYFRVDGLRDFAEQHGWMTQRTVSDFPIDLFLLDEHSNYVERPEVGKGAHWARIDFDEIFRDTDDESMLRFYEATADIGLGRNVIGVFAPA